jgi:putative intracellular protease/amidase
MMKKVLIFLTNHDTLGKTNQANGTYAPELTHVVDVLNKNNIDFELASINGGKAPLYGEDTEGDDVNSAVLKEASFQEKINRTVPAAKIDIEQYDGIFYPGGFGLLTDLASNEQVGTMAAKHYEAGGVIAAVCHGPAALLAITLSNGDALLTHKHVTAFTHEEEVDFGTIGDIPFLLEEALTRKASKYSKVQPWNEFVIEDDRVITGQNPSSAHAVGVALVKHLLQ